MNGVTLEVALDNGRVEVWRAGVDDYWVNFIEADYSVRGTLVDIIKEIDEYFEGGAWV